MPALKKLKILFVINPGSGNNNTNWPGVIENYFAPLHHSIELFMLPDNCDVTMIEDKLLQFDPELAVAVGGDGTVKLVAECLLKKNIPLGILPGGSANGLAKELGISEKPQDALDVLVKGEIRKIHVMRVNGHLCVHLSDIGFNAFLIKKFETQNGRGMWGYLKASVKVLFKHDLMEVEMDIEGKAVKISAAMIVIANATKYGSGAVINPIGKLDDSLFEVIALKKISLHEIYRMTFFPARINPDKTEIFQTNVLKIRSRHRVHFQVDGEYLGKVNEINAGIIPQALEIIVPSIQ
ncbi:MAG: diacylglycerol kinase family lipid kinase [Gloeobacteraceae cyanobacterium ES-bin-316]|nr:diacylglycerol kinase family lipid kinase [Ferruginibacter sp.]